MVTGINMEVTETNMVVMEADTAKDIQITNTLLEATTGQVAQVQINTEVVGEVHTTTDMAAVDTPTDMVIDTVIDMVTGIVNTAIIIR